MAWVFGGRIGIVLVSVVTDFLVRVGVLMAMALEARARGVRHVEVGDGDEVASTM